MSAEGDTGASANGESADTVSIVTVALVVLGFAALHVWAATFVLTYHDEAYYWLWSTHPSGGYYDHPPMVAWWIWLGTTLFGDTLLGLRSMFIAAVVIASGAVYATGRVLFDRPTAARAAMWFNATILTAALGMIGTPDGPSALFWALAVMAFALVLKTEHGAWWLAVGLFAGLGVTSKYHVLFLGPGLVLCLLAYRDLRHWLWSPWTWAGGLIALIVFSPVIVWNYQHDWVSFAKQFGRVVDVRGFAPRFLPEYLLGLAGLLNPLIAVVAGITAWRWARGRLSTHRREIGVLVLIVLPFLLYMAIHALHNQVDGNWLAPVMSTLVVIGAFGGSNLIPGGKEGRGPRRLRAAVVPLGLAAAVVGIYFLQPHPPIRIGSWDPARRFHGWTELAADVDRLRQETGARWIVLDNYNYVAALSFQFRDKDIPVEQITERIRYAFRPSPGADLLSVKALLVLENPIENYAQCLAELTPVGTIEYRSEAGGATHATLRAYTAERIRGHRLHRRLPDACHALEA